MSEPSINCILLKMMSTHYLSIVTRICCLLDRALRLIWDVNIGFSAHIFVLLKYRTVQRHCPSLSRISIFASLLQCIVAIESSPAEDTKRNNVRLSSSMICMNPFAI